MYVISDKVHRIINLTKKELAVLRKVLRTQTISAKHVDPNIVVTDIDNCIYAVLRTLDETVDDAEGQILFNINILGDALNRDNDQIFKDMLQISLVYEAPQKISIYAAGKERCAETIINTTYFDTAHYVSTAMFRAESIAGAIGFKDIPENSSIVAGLHLFDTDYYLMSYQTPPEDGKPAFSPIFFVKLSSTVEKAIKNGLNVVKAYPLERVPFIIPSGYVVFGNVQNPEDKKYYWLGIVTEKVISNGRDIKKIWSEINSYRFLPIFNIDGNPISMNSIQGAQAIMSLILKENEINKDFKDPEAKTINHESAMYEGLPEGVTAELQKEIESHKDNVKAAQEIPEKRKSEK
jgi:hypothetical protein